jgi:hypothetical protein
VDSSPHLRHWLALPHRVRVRLDINRRTTHHRPAAAQGPPRGQPPQRGPAAPSLRPTIGRAPQHPRQLARGTGIHEQDEGSGWTFRRRRCPESGTPRIHHPRRPPARGVSYRTGPRDLLLYDPDDPDACQELIRLTQEEADALADLLGAARLTGHLAELQQQIRGLAISWLTIQKSSPYAGGSIADTQARSRTGVSIVAVLALGPDGLPSAHARYRLPGRRHRRGGRYPGRGPGAGQTPGRLTSMGSVILVRKLGRVIAARRSPPCRRSTCCPGAAHGATVSEPDSTASRFDRRASSYQDSTLQQFLFVPVHQTALRLALQLLPRAGRVLDIGRAADSSCAAHDPAIQRPSWSASTWPGGWWPPPPRSPPPNWPSAMSMAAPSACRSPTRCSTWSSPLSLYGTGRTCRPGSPRSAACSPRVGCWSSPTSFPAATAEVQAFPCCAAATPWSRPNCAPCWPPTAWRSSAPTTPAGSGARRPGHRSATATSGERQPAHTTAPAPLRQVDVPPASRLGRARTPRTGMPWETKVARPSREVDLGRHDLMRLCRHSHT